MLTMTMTTETIRPVTETECAVKQTTSSFPSAAEMRTRDLPPRDYWVYPLMPKKTKLQLSGLPKDGKGHLVELLAICLSEGIPFLCFDVPEKARVLYLEFDNSDVDLKDRIDLKLEELHVTGRNLYYKAYSRPMCLDMKDGDKAFDGANDLSRILKDFKNEGNPIDVIILDPRIKLMRGEANKDEVILSWTSNIREIIEEFGVSVLVVHHEGKFDYGHLAKKGLDSIKYNAWYDVLMSLKATRDDGDKITGGKLEFTGKIPDSGSLPLSFDENCIWSLSSTEAYDRTSKKEAAKRLIMEMAAAKSFEVEIKKAVLGKGIGQTTFHQVMSRLVRSGEVVSTPIDKNKRRISQPLTKQP